MLTFSSGALKLTDFGIAHAVGETTRTHMMGTPEYMSTEQITGRWRDCGPWTDLYALGCLAWQLVTGRLPLG